MNLHHVKIKAVRRILSCKSGLCVVHCEGKSRREGWGEREWCGRQKRKRKTELEEEGM